MNKLVEIFETDRKPRGRAKAESKLSKENPKYVENHRGKVKKFPDTCMKISKMLINFYKALVNKLVEIFETDRKPRGRAKAESKLSKENPKYVENHRGKVKKFPDTCMKISKVLINFYKALVSKLMEIFEADRTLRGRVMAESKLSECG